jgi:HSP20 family protein
MTLIKWHKPALMGLDMEEFFSNNNFFPSRNLPAVNISENDNSFNLEISAPGLKKENFKVETDDGVLNVSCEYKEDTKEEKKNYTRREFRSGSFTRSFNLPENVDENDIKAQYENGIVTLTIPKKELVEAKKTKEIAVS